MKKRTIVKYEDPEETLKFKEFINFASSYFQPEKKPRGKKIKKIYINKFATCDFETTNDKQSECAFVYSWSFTFMHKTIIGRDLQSFLRFSKMFSDAVAPNKCICFIHNLSYDIDFISGVYPFEKEDAFLTDPRKFLKADYYNFELRCSYFLTGLSLKNFTSEMNVKHKKRSGEKYDYSKNRYPWSGLKSYELEYIENDTLGLLEALEKFIGDENLYNLPYTKTGYVRRDLKKAISKISYSKRKSWQLDFESYKACKEAFRGGNTHANRYYCDTEIKSEIHGDIYSFDFASCYPATMLYSDHFPKRNFYRKGAIDFEDACYFAFVKRLCCIFRCRFYNIRLKDKYDGFPYISESKCLRSGVPILDNGRILEAQYIKTTITDLDLYIICKQYDFDRCEVYDSFMCSGGMLPEEIREVVFKYYKTKTELKGITGKNENGVDFEILYMRSKADLNASFGCCVMDVCKHMLLYDRVDEKFSYSEEYTDRQLLEKYNKKGFLSYAWGCFITSIARFWLQLMLWSIPKDKALYIDTDSIKCFGIDPHSFDSWNKDIIKKAQELGVIAQNRKGEVKYLGLFEQENKKPLRVFKTLGAKKYCYIDTDGELHLTVAGVGKVKGAKELLENGGIEAFTDGFIFRDAGGTKSKYNDLRPGFDTFDIIREGRKIHITKNIYISDTTYTLSRTSEYMMIVQIAKDFIEGGLENEYNVVYDLDSEIC